jgi:photosystem II stability/assembly factor-like uncharacterized protein
MESAAKKVLPVILITGALGCQLWANPSLTPGVWKEITPSQITLGNWVSTVGIQVDPIEPSTLYLHSATGGLWKSANGGESWSSMNGNLPTPLCIGSIRVDPRNHLHMYIYGGVNGSASMGFWRTTDGGTTWNQPQSFGDGARTTWVNDVYWIAPDPSDFNHILLTFHSPWNAAGSNGNSGVLESKDGGDSWIPHYPSGNWQAGLGVNFLYCPEQNIGNSNTWMVGTQWGGGYYRTTDAGATWQNVTTNLSIHGATQIYYAKTGIVYSGCNYQMMRSSDNGLSWTSIGPKFNDGYYCLIGDGNYLYAQEANTGTNTAGPQPYVTSPETDGINWTAYNGGTQKFQDGPYDMAFDKVNRIVYSANWDHGLWALKVIDPATAITSKNLHTNRASPTESATAKAGVSNQARGIHGRNVQANGKEIGIAATTGLVVPIR